MVQKSFLNPFLGLWLTFLSSSIKLFVFCFIFEIKRVFLYLSFLLDSTIPVLLLSWKRWKLVTFILCCILWFTRIFLTAILFCNQNMTNISISCSINFLLNKLIEVCITSHTVQLWLLMKVVMSLGKFALWSCFKQFSTN